MLLKILFLTFLTTTLGNVVYRDKYGNVIRYESKNDELNVYEHREPVSQDESFSKFETFHDGDKLPSDSKLEKKEAGEPLTKRRDSQAESKETTTEKKDVTPTGEAKDTQKKDPKAKAESGNPLTQKRDPKSKDEPKEASKQKQDPKAKAESGNPLTQKRDPKSKDEPKEASKQKQDPKAKAESGNPLTQKRDPMSKDEPKEALKQKQDQKAKAESGNPLTQKRDPKSKDEPKEALEQKQDPKAKAESGDPLTQKRNSNVKTSADVEQDLKRQFEDFLEKMKLKIAKDATIDKDEPKGTIKQKDDSKAKEDTAPLTQPKDSKDSKETGEPLSEKGDVEAKKSGSLTQKEDPKHKADVDEPKTQTGNDVEEDIKREFKSFLKEMKSKMAKDETIDNLKEKKDPKPKVINATPKKDLPVKKDASKEKSLKDSTLKVTKDKNLENLFRDVDRSALYRDYVDRSRYATRRDYRDRRPYYDYPRRRPLYRSYDDYRRFHPGRYSDYHEQEDRFQPKGELVPQEDELRLRSADSKTEAIKQSKDIPKKSIEDPIPSKQSDATANSGKKIPVKKDEVKEKKELKEAKKEAKKEAPKEAKKEAPKESKEEQKKEATIARKKTPSYENLFSDEEDKPAKELVIPAIVEKKKDAAQPSAGAIGEKDASELQAKKDTQLETKKVENTIAKKEASTGKTVTQKDTKEAREARRMLPRGDYPYDRYFDYYPRRELFGRGGEKKDTAGRKGLHDDLQKPYYRRLMRDPYYARAPLYDDRYRRF